MENPLTPPNKVEKVDIEEIVKSFKVSNIDAFTSYLKEVWCDLTQRSEEKEKGVNKLTFISYYQLPGIISDRGFSVFDRNNNGHIDINEFLKGMKTLFIDPFDRCSKFIFNFYDFDKDGFITREDIRTVLSYITLNKKQNSNEAQGYLERVHSQEELHNLLEKSFSSISKDKINYDEFLFIIENIASDIYIFILLFLLDKKPFSKTALSEYEKQLSKSPKNNLRVPGSKMVASPTVNINDSLLSPSLIFIRESQKRRTLEQRGLKGNAKLLKDAKGVTRSGFDPNANRSKTKQYTVKTGKAISGFIKQQQMLRNQEDPEISISNEVQTNLIEFNDNNEEIISDVNIPVSRKTKTNLKNIESNSNSTHKDQSQISKYNDLELMPAFKQNDTPTNNKANNKLLTGSDKSETASIDYTEASAEFINSGAEADEPNEDGNLFSENSGSDDEDDVIKHSGYLYKLIECTKLKRLWFKLLHKDGYFFKNEKEAVHKGMHNLAGVFLKEGTPQVFNDKVMYMFSIVYPKKERVYYVDNESQYKIWIEKIKAAIGFTNGTDIYQVSKKIGNGKFGLVKLGINKQTGKQVAIKIMSKKDMKNDDLEGVRTEIEIGKICQHPNIINGYEVFENVDYYYIIMENCLGGDLFSFLEARSFKLTEASSCRFVHKMGAAVFYLHSYGIIHRDIKPENMLMTVSDDNADIRLLDFGLSKILGPGEWCHEPYGTLSYVAPEVLLEKPYSKAVDMWSGGVTTYLLLCGKLPFDHPSNDREIARQTINDKLTYKGSAWKEISEEAMDFVTKLLIKNPEERMTVKEALEHPWIKKFNKVEDLKGKNNVNSEFKKYSSPSDS